MSITALNWAKKQRVSPTQKLVLLVLADCADNEGIAFPSMAYLEEITGLSDRSIRTAKKAMMAAKIITKEQWMRVNDVRLSLDDNFEKTEALSTKTEVGSRKKETRSENIKTETPSIITEALSTKTEVGSAVPEPPITTKNHHSIPPSPPSEKSRSKKSTASKPKAAMPKVDLPDWMPLKAWDGWLEMRRGKKCPATPRALELAVKKLAGLRAQGHDPEAVLDQSTMMGWQGLFPVKPDRSGQLPHNVTPFPRPMSPAEQNRRGSIDRIRARQEALRNAQ